MRTMYIEIYALGGQWNLAWKVIALSFIVFVIEHLDYFMMTLGDKISRQFKANINNNKL